MKKMLIFLVLGCIATSASAFKCTRWVDAEGYERFTCDFSQPKPKGELIEPRLKYPADVSIHKGVNGQFTVYDSTNNVYKLCHKANGIVQCR